MACKHTGLCFVVPDFMDALERLRGLHGAPLRVTSGYRHATHPVEQMKPRPGTHNMGLAADLAVYGDEAHAVLSLALGLGFTGIGIQQSSRVFLLRRFIHLDMLPSQNDRGITRPWLWSYSLDN